MKPFVILCLLITCSFAANSQISKGYWLLGGGGQFYSYISRHTSTAYNTESKYTKIDLSSNVGFFVKDRLAIGVRPAFSSHKGESIPGGIRTNIQRYWIGPFTRYYFLKPRKQVNILTDISYQYGILDVDDPGKLNKLNQFSAMVGPVVYLNNSVGIEFLLGYSSSMEEWEGIQKLSTEGLQIRLGFQIHLKK